MTAANMSAVSWPPPVDAPRPHELVNRHRPPSSPSRLAPPRTSSGVTPPSHVLVLVPIRVFLAVGWLRAGIEKLIDPRWWNGSGLRAFLAANDASAVPPFRPIMEHAIHPLAILVAFVVMATEIACAIAIGVGRPMRAALRWATILNITFVLCGQVNPSAFYLVMQIVLLVAIADGTIGTRPSLPSRRTYALAGALFSTAVFLVQYIRTIEPARVIGDPAIVLVFLAVIEVTTLLLRCVFANTESQSSKSRSIWSLRVADWVRARPQSQMPNLGNLPVGQRSTAPNVVSAVGWRRSAWWTASGGGSSHGWALPHSVRPP
ncbi:MAG: hypothetical protein ACXVIH_12575, partial [Ilumatobacteraceae bacterium]